MPTENTRYFFLPFLRKGFSALIPRSDKLLPAAPVTRFAFEMKLNLKVITTNNVEQTPTIEKTVELYGPGDIVTIDNNCIRSIEPVNNAGESEPNFFPAITLREADYPWRATALGHTTNFALQPWLTLVVLVAEDNGVIKKEFDSLEGEERRDQSIAKKPPYIRNVSGQNLPDLNEAWRWAHVHITGPSSMETTASSLGAYLRSNPNAFVSRIICTRKLTPGVLYNAFLVPTFKLSFVAAGLVERDAMIHVDTPAWTAADRNLSIPYFFRWEFRTGDADFESLVRRLQPRVLDNIGLRSMDCGRPGYGITATAIGSTDRLALHLEGALKSLQLKVDPWGRDSGSDTWNTAPLQLNIESLLNLNSNKIAGTPIAAETTSAGFSSGRLFVRDGGVEIKFDTATARQCRINYRNASDTALISANDTGTPLRHSFTLTPLRENDQYRLWVEAMGSDGTWQPISQQVSFVYLPATLVLPPLYGQWHLQQESVNASPAEFNWFQELNLDPRHRAAAGLGSEVIRRKQETFMASAWEQAGELDFANSLIKKGQLGIEVCRNIFQRLSQLTHADFLTYVRPIHSRTTVSLHGKDATAYAHINASRVPATVFDHSFRKLTRPSGKLKKRMRKAGWKLDGRTITDRLNYPTAPFNPAPPVPAPPGSVLNLCDLLAAARKKQMQSPTQPTVTPVKPPLTRTPVTPMAPTTIPGASVPTAPQPIVPQQPTTLQTLLSFFKVRTVGELPVLDPCDGTMYKYFKSFRDSMEQQRIEPGITPESGPAQIMQTLFYALSEILEPKAPVAQRPTLDIPKLTSELKQAIDPAHTIPSRLRSKIKAEGTWSGAMDVIMDAPEFNTPMYKPLMELSPDFICPGIERIQDNTVGLLKTNRFIEAYMCGLNHAFAAELLWREYPTDQRGTYFKQFWEPIVTPGIEQKARQRLGYSPNAPLTAPQRQALESTIRVILNDIKPIPEWNSLRLGNNPSELIHLRQEDTSGPDPCAQPLEPGEGSEVDEENLCMIMKGDLLRKYPETEIYIYREEHCADANKIPEDFFSDLENTISGGGKEGATIFQPFFKAGLPPDIHVRGFNLKVKDIMRKTHYLVLEEKVTRARFGLDAFRPVLYPAPSWENLSWPDFITKDDGYLNNLNPVSGAHLPQASILARWASSSAQIGSVTYQKPVRIVINLKEMIPPGIMNK